MDIGIVVPYGGRIPYGVLMKITCALRNMVRCGLLSSGGVGFRQRIDGDGRLVVGG